MSSPEQEPSYISNSQTEITESGNKEGENTSYVNAIRNDSILLGRIFSRPPGTSFLGTNPCIANVNIGELRTKAIIDSGSDITLISFKLYNSIKPKPSIHRGKKISLTQVTHKSSIEEYVKLNLEFKTDGGIITIKVEAYLVKDMSSPLILGNDFAEQYEISIIRSKGTTRMQFGKEKYSLLLQLIDKPNDKVTTLVSQSDTRKHKKDNSHRSKDKENKKEGICSVLIDTEIPPNTSKRVKLVIPWKDEMVQEYIEPGGK